MSTLSKYGELFAMFLILPLLILQSIQSTLDRLARAAVHIACSTMLALSSNCQRSRFLALATSHNLLSLRL